MQMMMMSDDEWWGEEVGIAIVGVWRENKWRNANIFIVCVKYSMTFYGELIKYEMNYWRSGLLVFEQLKEKNGFCILNKAYLTVFIRTKIHLCYAISPFVLYILVR